MWHILYRLPLLILQIIISFSSLLFCNPLGRFIKIGRYSIAQYTVRYWAKLTCVLFGLRPRLIGQFQQEPLLVVANHQSWQDIIVLLSLKPLSFVAKQEIRHWPIVGILVAAAGTLFIQRGNKRSSDQIQAAMQQAFSHHNAILIFPEAGVPLTAGVGRFYGRLFIPAIVSQTPIQPIAIRYLENGLLSQRSRFKPNEGFIVNFFRLLSAPITVVEVHTLTVITAEASSQHRKLARQAEQQVRDCYDPDNLLDHDRAKNERPV